MGLQKSSEIRGVVCFRGCLLSERGFERGQKLATFAQVLFLFDFFCHSSLIIISNPFIEKINHWVKWRLPTKYRVKPNPNSKEVSGLSFVCLATTGSCTYSNGRQSKSIKSVWTDDFHLISGFCLSQGKLWSLEDENGIKFKVPITRLSKWFPSERMPPSIPKALFLPRAIGFLSAHSLTNPKSSLLEDWACHCMKALSNRSKVMLSNKTNGRLLKIWNSLFGQQEHVVGKNNTCSCLEAKSTKVRLLAHS